MIGFYIATKKDLKTFVYDIDRNLKESLCDFTRVQITNESKIGFFLEDLFGTYDADSGVLLMRGFQVDVSCKVPKDVFWLALLYTMFSEVLNECAEELEVLFEPYPCLKHMLP